MDLPHLSDAGITHIIFTGCSVFAPPPEIFLKFGNAKKLTIIDQNIQEIQLKTFQNATLLEELDIHQNKLTRLDGHVFEGASNLTNLFLYEGNIREVDVNAFKELRTLETLWLHDNSIQYLHVDTFSSNPELTDLRLNGNNLLYLNFEMFSRRGSKLSLLDLRDNLCVNRNFYYASTYEIERELRFCDLPNLLRDFDRVLRPHGPDSAQSVVFCYRLIFAALVVVLLI